MAVKRRQAQKKADGTESVPKELCPKCENYLKTAGGREGKTWKRIGLYCPNPSCDYIIKDYIELEDMEEEE
jgi:hypothetical protein